MYLLLFLNLWMNEWRLLERKRQLQSPTKWRNKSCYIFEQRKQAAPIKVGVLCSLNRRRQRQRRSKKQRTDDLRKARPSRRGKTRHIPMDHRRRIRKRTFHGGWRYHWLDTARRLDKISGRPSMLRHRDFRGNNKNLAIANRSRVSCAHNTLRASKPKYYTATLKSR